MIKTKQLFISALLFFSANCIAETIKIYSPYSPSHSATPALLKIINEANSQQNVYKFLLEFKPGGNQLIAVKSIEPENSLAIIAPAFVENVSANKLNIKDYVPVYALGDACWVAVTNGELKGRVDLVVGGVGFGNAAHLTALALGEKYKFNVRYIVFKSNNEALINMAGNNGVDFVIDKYEAYQSVQSRNPNLRLVAASCPTRIPQAPQLKTFKELGVDAPYVFNIIVAHTDMPVSRRTAIKIILQDATKTIGAESIYNMSAMRPPQFDGINVDAFYTKSISTIQQLQLKYSSKLANN